MFSIPTRVMLAVACAFAAVVFMRGAEPQVIQLWPEGVPGLKADAAPTRAENGRYLGIHYPDMAVYPAPADKATGTAVVYCPGGGYERVAAGVNGGEVARWLTSLGITVFELRYRNKEYGHPAPLQDGARAMRLVRSRAAEFGVRPDRIGALGGSAGAHLAASLGTLFDSADAKTGALLDGVSARPDFVILIFPVITMTEPYGHDASRRNLIGENPTPELVELLSVERHVTKDTPPTFIVHSQQDRVVVVQNSLMFYDAMSRAGVPGELHLYARGPHGSGMDPRLGPTAQWPKHCESWLRFNGWLPEQN